MVASSNRQKPDRSGSSNLLHFLFLLIATPFLSQCGGLGGLDGPEVVEVGDFKAMKERALNFYAARCYPDTFSSSGTTGLEKAVSGGYALSSELVINTITPGAARRYYTKKDVNFCLQALYAAPCSGPPLLFSDFIVADSLYCHPERASLWENQHPGEGELSLPAGGPNL